MFLSAGTRALKYRSLEEQTSQTRALMAGALKPSLPEPWSSAEGGLLEPKPELGLGLAIKVEGLLESESKLKPEQWCALDELGLWVKRESEQGKGKRKWDSQPGTCIFDRKRD